MNHWNLITQANDKTPGYLPHPTGAGQNKQTNRGGNAEILHLCIRFSSPRQHMTQALCQNSWHLTTIAVERTNKFLPASPHHWAAVTDSGPRLSSGCQCVLITVLLPCLNSNPGWPPPLTFPYSSARLPTPVVLNANFELRRLSLETIQPWKRE